MITKFLSMISLTGISRIFLFILEGSEATSTDILVRACTIIEAMQPMVAYTFVHLYLSHFISNIATQMLKMFHDNILVKITD